MNPFKFLIILLSCFVLKLQVRAEINYNKDIRPILSDKCLGCHGPDLKEAKAKLQLHTFDTATKALGKAQDRWAIFPKDLSKSEAWARIITDDEDEVMPPAESHKELSSHEKELIKEWIESGAEYEEHWSFKKLSDIQVPVVKNKAWVNNEIDNFVLSKCNEAGLKVSDRAEPSLLVRRLYLDLTGLPAPFSVMNEFESNPSPAAYQAIVNKLLNSDQYAERMALDWLDTARYADTNGYSIDDHRDMWAWRDWVIHAYATNKPYDQFILEQVAGDLIPDATVQQKVATGFLRNSMSTHEGGTIEEEYRVAYTKDKVDVVATTVMGLTMKCAQCHDHKYDPISQKEYYQFYAYFNSGTESGRGGVNGNANPSVKSNTPYCDETRLKAELAQRIKGIEQTIFESIPNFEARRKEWSDGILHNWKLSKTKQHSQAKVIKASLKPQNTSMFWIWSEKPVKNNKVEFEKRFDLDAHAISASLQTTCDNSATIFINNKKVGVVTDWTKPLMKDVSKFLRKGENIIKVKAENAGGVAGFISQLEVKTNSKTVTIQTDASWKAKYAGSNGFVASKQIEAYGKGAWGKVFKGQAKNENVVKLIQKGIEQLTEKERKEYYKAMFKDLKLENVYTKTLSKEIDILENVKKEGKVSTMIMDHGKRDTFMLIRGDYSKHGEKVTPALPVFLPVPSKEEAEPNRLGLAKWLTRKDHPLTSRVMVNRVWQMLMGKGLVETSEDFGSQGSWPLHEKLLNYLAYDFVEKGWDIKRLMKLIVSSSTYQQSSKANVKQEISDPRNEFFSHAPRFRLAAEIIRDKTLYHAGLINPKVGGPSVYPNQPDNLWREISHYGYGKPFTSQIFIPSKGKNLYRKSMYTFWKRTMSPPNMTIFDAPTRETCSARRLTTNTPLQALVLMNDPQFFNAARHFGKVFYADSRPFETKIKGAYKQVTGHLPSEVEYQTLEQAYQLFVEHYQEEPNEAKLLLKADKATEHTSKQAAYVMLASTLLNLDEAITRQ